MKTVRKRGPAALCGLVLALVLAVPALAAEAPSFNDVTEDKWFFPYVTELAALGGAAGYEDGSFRPNGTITRAEMAAVICRLARLDTQSTTVPFQDVSPSDWAAKYIAAAYQAGSIWGSGGRFRPNDPVSYPEAVKMIVCAAGLGEGIPSSGPNWAEGYLAAAQEHGITDGLPDQTAVRGNVALMAYNALYRPAGAFGTYKLDAAGQIARDYRVTRDGGYSLRLSSQVPNHRGKGPLLHPHRLHQNGGPAKRPKRHHRPGRHDYHRPKPG